MRRSHAAEVSLLATYQPTAWPRAMATGTTASRCRWMPSRCTTSYTSSMSGTGGHRFHISSFIRRRVRAGTLRSAWLSLENSQRSDASRSMARRSYGLVEETPQPLSLHRQRVLPDDVDPFFFIVLPHAGHRGILIPPRQPLLNPPHAYCRNASRPVSDTHSGRPQNPGTPLLNPSKPLRHKGSEPISDTHFGL